MSPTDIFLKLHLISVNAVHFASFQACEPCLTCVCFRGLELEESLGSSNLLQQNIKQKDEKVTSLNQVIQEREEKLAELENRSEFIHLH